MSTLYRKYRPQSFSDVIGQEHVKITLQNEIERGELGHAYLFCGPRGLGKTTLSRVFARSLLCDNSRSNGDACMSCTSCVSFKDDTSPDYHEYDATQVGNVSFMRELKQHYEMSKRNYKMAANMNQVMDAGGGLGSDYSWYPDYSNWSNYFYL